MVLLGPDVSDILVLRDPSRAATSCNVAPR
jgi:hypothetical protein